MAQKTTNNVLLVIGILLGVFFAYTGYKKLFTDWEWARQTYLRDHPLWVYTASGVVELLAGIGLMIPITRVWSCIAMATMIVAVSPPWKTDWAKPVSIFLTIGFPLLFLMLAWFSRSANLVASSSR